MADTKLELLSLTLEALRKTERVLGYYHVAPNLQTEVDLEPHVRASMVFGDRLSSGLCRGSWTVEI